MFIAEKLGVSQPTAAAHMKVLREAGMVTPKRIKSWTFCKRGEAGMAKARDLVLHSLQ